MSRTCQTDAMAAKIKELRARENLSQSRFAEKYHISKRTLQNWEQGIRRIPDYVPYMIERIMKLEPSAPERKIGRGRRKRPAEKKPMDD